MSNLSHKFWLWVGKKIKQHQFREEIKGEYPFEIDMTQSTPMTATDLARRKVIEDWLDEGAAIKKGYDRPQ